MTTTAFEDGGIIPPHRLSELQFNADGSVNTAQLTPATAGAGAATGAQAMRSMQMQIRFTF